MFSEGQSFSQFPIRVLYIIGENKTEKVQAGVAVSSRNFKKAVDRNRVKRLMREAWRLQKNVLEDTMVNKERSLSIFMIYTGSELPVYEVLSGKFADIIKKLQSIMHESDPVHT